jgi:DNA repair photolyase
MPKVSAPTPPSPPQAHVLAAQKSFTGASSTMRPHLRSAPFVADERRSGRGAISNPTGRFETLDSIDTDDGWGVLETLPAFKTQTIIERPRTIITRNDSPDIPFDRSLNPYRGCEHGCVYCFARPTHAYMGHSAGLDFETKLYIKEGAAQLLERECAKPGYTPKTLALGTNTDPYQPLERQHRITRSVLETLDRLSHPVTIVTKSALVTRDIDILSSMAKRGLVKVALSITTLNRSLARAMEPRASTPQRRIEAIAQLANAGVPTMVMVAPIIPALTDAEMDQILETAAGAGALEAGYVLLRLPLDVDTIFSEWLLRHAPDKYRHVMSLIRSMREGKHYDAQFGKRMVGSGPYAAMIARRFQLTCQRLGLTQGRSRLRTDLFQPPTPKGQQLSLLSLFADEPSTAHECADITEGNKPCDNTPKRKQKINHSRQSGRN